MQNTAIRKVKDLEAPTRQWMASVFGRPLRDDEEVTLTVFPPHAAPASTQRESAAERMDHILDKAAEQLKHSSDAEYETAVDEAMEQVRRWK